MNIHPQFELIQYASNDLIAPDWLLDSFPELTREQVKFLLDKKRDEHLKCKVLPYFKVIPSYEIRTINYQGLLITPEHISGSMIYKDNVFLDCPFVLIHKDDKICILADYMNKGIESNELYKEFLITNQELESKRNIIFKYIEESHKK